jgi:hypothetical protein
MKLFSRDGHKNAIIMMALWRKPFVSNDTLYLVPGATYSFGIFSCSKEQRLPEVAAPYPIRIPSINTFTFVVDGECMLVDYFIALSFLLESLEYFESTYFGVKKTKTDILLQRQSVLPLEKFEKEYFSAKITFSPDGFATNVRRFITTPSFNFVVNAGNIGGHIKWVILIYLLLFGNMRLRVTGVVQSMYLRYHIQEEKHEDNINQATQDELKYLIEKRFHEFQQLIDENYLRGIHFDFSDASRPAQDFLEDFEECTKEKIEADAMSGDSAVLHRVEWEEDKNETQDNVETHKL